MAVKLKHLGGMTQEPDSTALTYAKLVEAKAKLQQSRFMGVDMGTIDYDTHRIDALRYSMQATAINNAWINAHNTVAGDDNIYLTPIQQIRAGLSGWLKPLL